MIVSNNPTPQSLNKLVDTKANLLSTPPDISVQLARSVPLTTFSFLKKFFITLPTASASEVAVYTHLVKSQGIFMSGIINGPDYSRFTEVCEIVVPGNCINLQ
ncbi:hypothetical protein PtA15_5A705 [Puccinia triticina]|uniref:Uncharacterized protein n=1 Tax=Puccinia triticina TaxID=208348 RepID=A0ABY7CIT6_9BASI|nr:uncharacterized protein PtA15_5A705 [Puccinia triticina]WAQ85131.1 hypothetical protein PtA15_5A705 [Puccinia triticina]